MLSAILTSPELCLPDGPLSLLDQGDGGNVIEVAALGREAEGEVGHDRVVVGQREVEADAAQRVQVHGARVLVLQHVPVPGELREQEHWKTYLLTRYSSI